MKVLMLTPYLPFPLLSGGQTRSYNLIKNLSKKHEITLYCLIKDKKEKKYIPELKKYCKKVKVFARPKKPWTLRNILKTGFGPYPFVVIRNLVPEEKVALQDELASANYDLIHAETFYVMPHIPKTNVPILLVDQTIEHMVYKHFVEKQSNALLRPILMIDVLKIRYWESFYWKRAKKVIAVSASDRKKMKKLVPGLEINIVPNGIDIEYFSEKKRGVSRVKKILYVGNFTWLQNKEAVETLVRKVWPRIKKGVAKSKLWIVGMNMTEGIKNLASNDIEITEAIPDIRDAYKNASVLVTPIKGPGGTRLKILEAMASALPVVTTPIGAGGLDLVNGKHALIENDYNELADSAIRVLKDKHLSEKLGREGRNYVKNNYSWEKSAKILDDTYRQIVHG